MSTEKAEHKRPGYSQTRAALLRGMGFVYLSAFCSLAVQVDGLLGSRGILPVAQLMDQARQGLGASPMRFWYLPSLLWLDASDKALHFLCWGGVLLAAAVMIGLMPGPLFCLLWL